MTALGAGLVGLRDAGATAGQPWGSYPPQFQALAVPPSKIAKRVLEVHIAGGLSPWENIYAIPNAAYGQNNARFLYTFLNGKKGLLELLAKCGDSTAAITQPYAQDSLGNEVCLGPLTRPLWKRPDVIARMRAVVLGHDLFPHDPALGLADTGRGPGRPQVGSLGTIIARHVIASGEAGVLPPAQVLYSASSIAGQNNWLGSSMGSHPAAARPFRLASFGQYPPSLQLLESASGLDAAFADLRAALVADFAQDLKLDSVLGQARSLSMNEYTGAVQQYDQLAALKATLQPTDFTAPPVSLCGGPAQTDYTRINLKLAAALLNAEKGARYAYVLDASLPTDDVSSTAFDWHYNFAARSAPAMPYFWDRLMEVIAKPGEATAGKISLDDTMVVVTTEFGREPEETPGTGGRNHWPYAYPVLFIGGPVGSAEAGISGAINPYGGPVGAQTPAAQRAAILVAMGIYPFETGAYSWQDVAGAQSEAEALQLLRDQVLGVKA